MGSLKKRPRSGAWYHSPSAVWATEIVLRAQQHRRLRLRRPPDAGSGSEFWPAAAKICGGNARFWPLCTVPSSLHTASRPATLRASAAENGRSVPIVALLPGGLCGRVFLWQRTQAELCQSSTAGPAACHTQTVQCYARPAAAAAAGCSPQSAAQAASGRARELQQSVAIATSAARSCAARRNAQGRAAESSPSPLRVRSGDQLTPEHPTGVGRSGLAAICADASGRLANFGPELAPSSTAAAAASELGVKVENSKHNSARLGRPLRPPIFELCAALAAAACRRRRLPDWLSVWQAGCFVARCRTDLSCAVCLSVRLSVSSCELAA